MILKVKVNYPKDMKTLQDKAADTLAKILVNKLQPKEIDQLIEVLKDDKVNITM
ncbi:hypothetical protein SAMN05428976_11324 [Clostridium sp. USBA 49]|uniref:hypothetical protein n=1 Tax=Clostridium sp. USBA 49 TaxID=1881060 RepID=UPI0009C604CF|nr:hypothetical protein [Clostridium sp. USBA 49]SKA89528.1 hypothetical protein SAMN05428976_11324 [Clostridium sp. USBA 49]